MQRIRKPRHCTVAVALTQFMTAPCCVTTIVTVTTCSPEHDAPCRGQGRAQHGALPSCVTLVALPVTCGQSGVSSQCYAVPQVEYTPTIRLKTADGRVLEYEGDRSLEDVVNWVRRNAKSGSTRTTYASRGALRLGSDAAPRWHLTANRIVSGLLVEQVGGSLFAAQPPKCFHTEADRFAVVIMLMCCKCFWHRRQAATGDRGRWSGQVSEAALKRRTRWNDSRHAVPFSRMPLPPQLRAHQDRSPG